MTLCARQFGKLGRALALSIGLVVPLVPAHAQVTDYRALEDEVQRLRRELQDVQRQVYSSYSNYNQAQTEGPMPKSGAVPPGTVGQQAVGVQQPAVLGGTQRWAEIEDSLRRVTGQMEQMSFRIDQLTQQMQTLQGDMDFRLRALEQQSGLDSPELSEIGPAELPTGTMALGTTKPSEPLTRSTSAPTVTAAPTVGDVSVGDREFNTTIQSSVTRGSSGVNMGYIPGDASTQYEQAKALLVQGDFPAAEKAFTNFLNQYAEHELASEAQYWLGETYYVRGSFRNAGQAFTEGLSRYPESARGPDSLLKLGMSLAALKQTKQACSTFNEMSRRYPNAMQTVVQRVKVEKAKAGCKR